MCNEGLLVKRRRVIAVLSLWVALFAPLRCCLAQAEEEGTVREIKEAQEAARRFVVRMQQTRDVGALINELFLPGFVSHFVSEEGVSHSLYSRLSRSERERLFVVIYNLHYVSAITIMSDYDDMKVVYEEKTLKPRLLLPHSTLLKLRRALRQYFGKTELTSYQQIRSLLAAMETAVAEAIRYLKRRDIEQTAEFQRRVTTSDTLGSGINYRVRVYTGGQNVKDCEPLVGFPENYRFIRVELPILLGAIFIRDGEQMKIVRLTFVDGD